MAVKDVINYYNSICDDYSEMLDSLHDMEKEAQQGLVNPDRVDQLKSMIAPVKDNYMRISYIMFLLNKPTKFTKFLNKIGIKTKDIQYSQKFDASSTLEAIKEEDKKAMSGMSFKK